ncbi:glutamate 5-kinase [Allobaculum fili]|uniref:glutamate 5-kinase n=2 Tax=Erysipelotrichaceae TaxID=128827 RepID=UPI001E424ACB|nr:glutamate 5-kinase [Allobaculum fili]
MSSLRTRVKDAKRIVVKVGSSSLTYPETGRLNFDKLDVLVRQVCSLHNAGYDVVLVSSGAIMVGSQYLGLPKRPHSVSRKQACAAVGQARLMMLYQKIFAEYGLNCGQLLLTKHTMRYEKDRFNAKNTFEELFDLGVIPIVNENDTIATDEIEIGDNDSLSALVAALVKADLLVLLSDIDGLYTDDPSRNPDARFIDEVAELNEEICQLAKGPSSGVGTGGMTTKIHAARIAGAIGCDMIIANAKDFRIIEHLVAGEPLGTFFAANPVSGLGFDDLLEELE